MHYSGALVHAITGVDHCQLVLVHETCPTFEHVDDMKICLMAMPAGADFGRHIRLHQLGDDLAAGGSTDAKIAIQEKIAQTARSVCGIAFAYMRKRGFGYYLV